jgi:hypothetical protein
MRRVVAVLVILFIVLGTVAAISLYLVKDNVTVSGNAYATYTPGTIIQEIEFVDTQTGASTAFQFHQASGDSGHYSVTLKNGHTYNVYISFYVITPEPSQTHFTTIFYVNATDGQTVITKDFWYPYDT